MNEEEKAMAYAVNYGILEYEVRKNKMIFYANYPAYLSEKRRSYKVTVDLDSMKEESRVLQSRFNSKGNANMYL